MAKTNTAETEEKTESGDAPLIDLNEASIKKLIARARKRGVITYDELNDALPQGEMSSDQIEDIQSALSSALKAQGYETPTAVQATAQRFCAAHRRPIFQPFKHGEHAALKAVTQDGVGNAVERAGEGIGRLVGMKVEVEPTPVAADPTCAVLDVRGDVDSRLIRKIVNTARAAGVSWNATKRRAPSGLGAPASGATG